MNGTPSDEELVTARQWFAAAFEAPACGGEPRAFPVTFRCGDDDSAALVGRARASWQQAVSAPGSERRTLVLLDPCTGLELCVEVTLFDTFPAVEWVAYLRNTSEREGPLICDLQALEAGFDAAADTPCRVHYALGSDCKLDDFAPRETPLAPHGELCLAPFGGRASEGTLPFFNLEMQRRGVIGAIGWSGGWAATFRRGAQGPVQVRAGMRHTHFKLLPGEQIRTPRILLLLWEGERPHAHNMLRRLLLAHYTPHTLREPARAPIAVAVWGENHAANQIAKARWWKDNHIGIDHFWIDAGWHGDGPFQQGSTVFNSQWWRHVGNWWPNRNTYPQGLAPVGDALRQMGLGFVLWLEPERVFKDTAFTREHPEWLLGPVGDNFLFNLGLPEARQALTDLVSSVIEQAGLTCYRQDFNMDPAPFWQAADAPHRVGMSEIRHLEGLYAFWDELLARHPGLMIDNCSSGGRRIDLETISRSIPLWRSDFQCWPGFDPIAIQGQTQGLAPWVPLSAGACDTATSYAFRSALGPGMVITSNIFEPTPPPPFPPDKLRQLVAEARAVQPYFYGDFYPLLSFSLADDAWTAWQFDRPDLGEGMVLALRRPQSPFPCMEAPLRGLDPQAQYEVHSADGAGQVRLCGRDLMERGIQIQIPDKPGSALYIYRRRR